MRTRRDCVRMRWWTKRESGCLGTVGMLGGSKLARMDVVRLGTFLFIINNAYAHCLTA